MKIKLILSFTVILISSLLILFFMPLTRTADGVDFPEEPPEKIPTNDSESFAVLELFTSEGCSSCPSADKLLDEMYDAYRTTHDRVYALAFHVDYWDYIGWKDELAKQEFTQRQRWYGERFQLESIYTPQLVINGSEECVGSNRSDAAKAITNALLQTPTIRLELTAYNDSIQHRIHGEYRINNIPDASVIHIALIENKIIRRIQRGENAGRTLLHNHVVRLFKTMQPKSETSFSLDVPRDANPSRLALVAYLQDTHTGRVFAADGADIFTKY